MLSLDDFVDDQAWTDMSGAFEERSVPNQIDGLHLHRLVQHQDGRGNLTVLATDRLLAGFSAPHVYLVTAAAGSVRAWVYDKRQSDRLAYTMGQFRVVLFDLRPASPTFQQLNVLDIGAAQPTLLTIPPFVVHGVQNRGAADSQFINMPTRAYDPAHPDKSRLPHGHPGIPYVFD